MTTKIFTCSLQMLNEKKKCLCIFDKHRHMLDYPQNRKPVSNCQQLYFLNDSYLSRSWVFFKKIDGYKNNPRSYSRTKVSEDIPFGFQCLIYHHLNAKKIRMIYTKVKIA